MAFQENGFRNKPATVKSRALISSFEFYVLKKYELKIEDGNKPTYFELTAYITGFYDSSIKEFQIYPEDGKTTNTIQI